MTDRHHPLQPLSILTGRLLHFMAEVSIEVRQVGISHFKADIRNAETALHQQTASALDAQFARQVDEGMASGAFEEFGEGRFIHAVSYTHLTLPTSDLV